MAKLLHLSRPSKRVAGVVRTWWAMRSQKRRRTRERTGAAQVPDAPTGLVGVDVGGGVQLNWDMSGVHGEDGCSVEGRRDVEPFEEVGSVGSYVSTFMAATEQGGTWQFRVRAFNAAGFSAYSNVATVVVT